MQVDWPTAQISFQNSQGCWSSVCSRCAQRCSWYCAPFLEPQRDGYIHPGAQTCSGQAVYVACFLKYLIWLAKLNNISLGSSKVPSASVLLSVPGAYFHSRILLYKWHLNSTSFLHSFQFDNSGMKTFAKDKCKVKDSKEKNYTGSPWRIRFSSFRPCWQCLIRWLSGRDPQWLSYSEISQARAAGKRSLLSPRLSIKSRVRPGAISLSSFMDHSFSQVAFPPRAWLNKSIMKSSSVQHHGTLVNGHSID